MSDETLNNCATCIRAGKRLTDDNGKCQACCDASKPGAPFPGYVKKGVK